jgi:hypothetical protein
MILSKTTSDSNILIRKNEIL